MAFHGFKSVAGRKQCECGAYLRRDNLRGFCKRCECTLSWRHLPQDRKDTIKLQQRENRRLRMKDQAARLRRLSPGVATSLECRRCRKPLRPWNKSGYCAPCYHSSDEKRAADWRRTLARRNGRSPESKVQFMLIGVKCRCKKLGIPFDITVADLLPPPEFCPVFPSIRLNYYAAGHQRNDSASIDRIAPHLGYVRGNVAIISVQANRRKQDSTLEELEAIIAYVRRALISAAAAA